MPELLGLSIYATPLMIFLIVYARRRRSHHRQSVTVRNEAVAAGLTEPASLHPVIDPTKCVGCASCIEVCPEMPGHKVLGLIHGKAQLIGPTECIGHGACLANCPADAITLVFGTERRGIDIPNVAHDFETNVPGIFIAGELGGMGLIRNAIEQGCQAMRSIERKRGGASGDVLDVLIVGAGPAGFAASLAAKERGLRFVTVEQETLGGTVAHYPRGKLVMTAPAHLPLHGKFRFRETTKEQLLEFWQNVERNTGVGINYRERVESIGKSGEDFEITTSRSQYRARAVLLAIGRRGTPRKLEVPGEELPKVTYRLIDPEQYRGQRVLVVGGGDSALEAACSIAEEPGSVVTLSYRSDAFSRAKPKNRERIDAAQSAGSIKVLMRSTVRSIEPDRVSLVHDEQPIDIENDAVIVSAGGILPTGFLRDLGIEVDTKFGTA
jgi:thioredoxin reductase/NAD-dependent dihydropyrimidine dehydrogenase PreA subunit